jgi:hypothetical protein
MLLERSDERIFGFSFLKWLILEHCLGQKAAIIPSMQMRLKIEPTNGFLMGNSSDVGGLRARRNTVQSPKVDMVMAKVSIAL